MLNIHYIHCLCGRRAQIRFWITKPIVEMVCDDEKCRFGIAGEMGRENVLASINLENLRNFYWADAFVKFEEVAGELIKEYEKNCSNTQEVAANLTKFILRAGLAKRLPDILTPAEFNQLSAWMQKHEQVDSRIDLSDTRENY